MTARNGVVMVVLCAGCAATVPYVPVASLPHPTREQYPAADAVFLLRDHRYAAVAPQRLAATWIETRHDVIALLTESGYRYATLRIELPERGRMLELRARTVSPTGEVRELRPEEVFEGHGHEITDEHKHRRRHKIMRLPGVSVGAILEYVYRIEHDEMFWWATERVSEAIPILRYHGEILTSENLSGEMVVYNATTKANDESEPDGTRHFIDLTDVPAMREEPMAPPWELDQPWWAYRSTYVTYGAQKSPLYANWADVMKYVSEALEGTQGKRYGGADLSLPGAASCKQDRRCLVRLALERLRSAAVLTRFDARLEEARSMKDVLASGHADNFEKAILLHGILSQAGVTSRYAVVARSAGLAPDPLFPLPERFDHLVLELLSQPGLPSAIVDPSCEACAMGEIPSWIDERPLTTLEDLRRAGGNMSIHLREINSAHVLPNETHTEFDARLSSTGELDATVTTSERGALAVDGVISRRRWTAERWTKELERAAHHLDKTARLGEHSPETCDRSHGSCELRYALSIASYATKDRGELIVPLSFLGWNAPEQRDTPRRRDLFLPRSTHSVDTYRLHVPPGWVIGALPSSAAWHSAAADIAVEITHTPSELTIVRTVTTRRGRWDKGAYFDLDAAAHALAAIARQSFSLSPAR